MEQVLYSHGNEKHPQWKIKIAVMVQWLSSPKRMSWQGFKKEREGKWGQWQNGSANCPPW